ncbi:MAG: methyltransferase domain-containing protein [Rubrivivax sp.]|nr:methyltransferase domain-containing protein [Rubrivivax sp.]
MDATAAHLARVPPGTWAGLKQRSQGALRLRAGQRVLDLGCGAATDTLALGRRVGPAGQVSGVDYDAGVVQQARARALAEGQGGWVSHHHANATALPWPEGAFDASHCVAMLQHLLEPDRALDELLRVTRRGGPVVVADIDWATLSIECGEPGIERRLVRHRIGFGVPNPHAGRRLHGLLWARGLEQLQCEIWPLWASELAAADELLQRRQLEDEALAAGVVDDQDLLRWRAALARSSATHALFVSVNAVLVSGRKP